MSVLNRKERGNVRLGKEGATGASSEQARADKTQIEDWVKKYRYAVG